MGDIEYKKYFEEAGINMDQVLQLKKAFDAFDSEKKGAISSETTGQILRMMGVKVSSDELQAIMDDVDLDKSGQLEFDEFVILSARLYKLYQKYPFNPF